MVIKLLFKFELEFQNFSCYVDVFVGKVEIVLVCVLQCFLVFIDCDFVLVVCSVSDYVLCFGFIELIKNQLQFICVFNVFGMNGVFVGGVCDDVYYEQCVQEVYVGIVFLLFVQLCSVLFWLIIDNCSVMVEVSNDLFGCFSFEVVIMKKFMVLVDGLW